MLKIPVLPKTTVETTNYQGIYPIELLMTSRLNPKRHIILAFLSCHVSINLSANHILSSYSILIEFWISILAYLWFSSMYLLMVFHVMFILEFYIAYFTF